MQHQCVKAYILKCSTVGSVCCADEVTAERCRSWLQQLQSFVVAVQKDLEILLATSSSSSLQRPLASSSILSSPAMSSISLSAGGSTAGSCCSSDADVEMTDVHADAHSVRHGQWDVLLRHTIDSLAVLLADDATMMAMQQGFDMPVSIPPTSYDQADGQTRTCM